MMEIQAVSVGQSVDVMSSGIGFIHSVFARAANLELRGDMWTVLASEKSDIPFGIRIAVNNLDMLGLRTGDPVNVGSGFVGIKTERERLIVDCRSAPRWMPRCAKKLIEQGLVDRLGMLAAATSARCWHHSANMARAVRHALDEPNTLDGALTRVVGLGPGATPSGDDVLVGILAVLKTPHSGTAGAQAAEVLGRSVLPLLSRTTYVSGQLLRQAVNGLFGQAVHEVLAALIENPEPRLLKDKIQRIVATGATSGADTCSGLLEFAPSFLLPIENGVMA